MSEDPLRLRSTATWLGESADGASSPRPPGSDDNPDEAITQSSGDATTIAARYVLAEELGRGGMAVVRAAYNRQLARRVAVKLLRPDHASSGGSARLVREAQALAQLRHPNVVTVFDAGAHDGQMFLAMELVAGDSLRKWMTQVKRPWREVVTMFIGAGRGLAAAHAAGLVHRDFKPDNVLLDGDGRPQVADFGLARFAHDRDSDDNLQVAPTQDVTVSDEPTRAEVALHRTVTRAGAVVGTPPYLAPEVMHGATADARSDQYSFGVSLTEALSGQRPYRGTTLDELARAIEVGPPRLDGVGPAWVRAVVERCLARDPERRFPSMAAVVEALGRDPSRRRRRVLAVAAAVLVAGGGVTAALALTGGAKESPSCAVLVPSLDGVWDNPRRAAFAAHIAASKLEYAAALGKDVERSLDAYGAALADGERDACEALRKGQDDRDANRRRVACLARRRTEMGVMVEELIRIDENALPRASRAVTRMSLVVDCADTEALRRLPDLGGNADQTHTLTELQASVDRARVFTQIAKYKEAAELLQPLVVRAAALGHPPTEAEVRSALGSALEGMDKLTEAEQQQRAALLAAQLGRHDVVFARTAAMLAMNIGRAQKRPGEGLTWADLAIATSARLGKPAALEGTAHYAKAVVLMGDHRADEAEVEAKIALAASQAAGYDDYQISDIINMLGGIALERGQFELARDQYSRARAITVARVGEVSPQIVTFDNNLASVALALGDFATSVRLRRHVLAARIQMLGPSTPRVSDAHLALAFSLLAAGESAEAVTEARLALEIAVAVGGADNPRAAGTRLSLATILAQSGQPAEAATLATEVEAAATKAGPGAATVRAAAQALLGDLALAAGKTDEAQQLFDSAAALCAETPTDAANALAMRGQARVAVLRGDPARAIDLYGRARDIFTKTDGPAGHDTKSVLDELARINPP